MSATAGFNASVGNGSKHNKQDRTHDLPLGRPRLSVRDNLKQSPTARERQLASSSDNVRTLRPGRWTGRISSRRVLSGDGAVSEKSKDS